MGELPGFGICGRLHSNPGDSDILSHQMAHLMCASEGEGTMTKAVRRALAAALLTAIIPGAKADFWFDPPAGLGVPDVRPETRGGPYYVAGFGDHIASPRKFWGGPYFVICSGHKHPYETYRMNCRPSVVKVATHEHRRIRARLK